jgi:hypothetical protein
MGSNTLRSRYQKYDSSSRIRHNKINNKQIMMDREAFCLSDNNYIMPITAIDEYCENNSIKINDHNLFQFFDYSFIMNEPIKWEIENILKKNYIKKTKKFFHNENKIYEIYGLPIIDFVQVNTKKNTFDKFINVDVKNSVEKFFENKNVIYTIEIINTKYNNDNGSNKSRCYSPDCLACRNFCYKKGIRTETKQNKITMNK